MDGRLWPLLCAIEQTKNLDDICVETIHGNVGKSSKHELPRFRVTTGAPGFREFSQSTNLLVNRKRHASRSGCAAMLFDVIADLREVADRRISPANSHQP